MTGLFATQGFSTNDVMRWKLHLGVDKTESGPPQPMQLSGRSGLATYSSTFARVVVDDPDEFDAVVYHRKLSMVSAHCELSTPRVTYRNADDYGDDSAGAFLVSVHSLDGQLRTRQNSHERIYGARQLVVIGPDGPFWTESTTVCETSTLIVPADLLGGDYLSRSVMPVAADTPLARATAQFVRRFVSDAVLGVSGIDADAEMAAVELIRAVLGQHCYTRRRVESGTRFIREAARELIERNYTDPDFTADSLAHRLHMSRRHLYRHFADTGDAPAAMIAARRLDRAREILSGPVTLSLEQVAAQSGFSSAATLRNRFRAEYGQTPSDYRDEMVGSGTRLSVVPPVAYDG